MNQFSFISPYKISLSIVFGNLQELLRKKIINYFANARDYSNSFCQNRRL